MTRVGVPGPLVKCYLLHQHCSVCASVPAINGCLSPSCGYIRFTRHTNHSTVHKTRQNKIHPRLGAPKEISVSDIASKMYSAIEKLVTTSVIHGSGSRTRSSKGKKVYDINIQTIKCLRSKCK